MKKLLSIFAITLMVNCATAQNGLKALKINSEINLNTGDKISSGAIFVLAEELVNIKYMENDTIPCQMVGNLYISLSAYNSGKSSVVGIQDFSPSFYNLKLPVSVYVNGNAQDISIGVVKQYLETIYPGKIEIISIGN